MTKPAPRSAKLRKLSAAARRAEEELRVAEETKTRRRRANQWRRFRQDHQFTQKRLADIVGISRRTVQQIEAGNINPHPITLRRFLTFKQKCKARGVEK